MALRAIKAVLPIVFSLRSTRLRSLAFALAHFTSVESASHPVPLNGRREQTSLFKRSCVLKESVFHSFLSSFESRALRAPRKNRRSLKQGLPLFVCMRFQDLFHSPPGVLFAFPSRYWFTIGRLRVFSLGGWSPHVQTGFHVPRPTCRTLSSATRFFYTGLSPTMAGLSRPF